MTEQLSARSQELIRSALTLEQAPRAVQHARIKRAVIIAVMAPAAAVASSGGSTGLAALKTTGFKLLPWLGAGSLGTKLTGAVLLAVSTTALATQLLPKVLPDDTAPPAVVVQQAPIAAAYRVLQRSQKPLQAAKPMLHGSAQSLGPLDVALTSSNQASSTHIALLGGALASAVSSSVAGPSARTKLNPTPPQGPPSNAQAFSSATALEARSKKPIVVSERSTRRHTIPPLVAGTGKSSKVEHQLQNELAELEAVQAQLRAGRGAAALKLLDSRTKGGTLLTQERLASEVFAACQVGHLDRARRAAQEFLERAPGSFLAERIRRSCAFNSEIQTGSR